MTKAIEAIDWGKKPAASQAGCQNRQGFRLHSEADAQPHHVGVQVSIVDTKGDITVLAGTVEIGQGCNTILSQVAAEELKVPMAKVHMHPLDTDVIPYDASTTSSRSTYHMGNAVRRASIHAREQIMEAAASDARSAKRGFRLRRR